MNAKRYILLLLAALLLLTGGLTYAATAAGEGTETTSETTAEEPPPPNWENSAEYRAAVARNYRAAVRHKKAAHYWLHKRGGGHGPWPGIHRPLRMTHSLAYEQYRRKLWKTRAGTAYRAYQAYLQTWAKRNRNIDRAIAAASRYYGVSASHLHSCVSSEGGHGAWKWNSLDGRTRTDKTHPLHIYTSSSDAPAGSSGAGGWFQFMSGTFWSDVQHTPVPRKFRKWNAPVAQAYAAAWHFKYHGTAAWTGPGC